ncbi:hypothetical protein CHS0354_038934 [Potamilus streckersoni]|uniref:Uncharacterized protein n=1 Tax=Potamilus streckersoni TaxID=2493646 RepID=A0AAE0S1F6_9BIVA|nr:hypothetical protein CHS0354_038934 [Potamilus streckersoni]
MATEETTLEKSIKNFVYSKIQEQVYLEVGKNLTIYIKHRSKHGSIALAMFWLRVMRHQNNYPMPKYSYKELYDQKGNDKIILKVDDITITVFNKTGTLTIQGTMALEWFLNRFLYIMEAYDAPICIPQPQTTIYRQYTENWKKLEVDDKMKKVAEEEKTKEKEEKALEIVQIRNQVITDVRARGDNAEAEKLEKAAKSATNDLAEELELMTFDLWPDSVVESQLKKLQTPCVKDGSTYIYKLWKSLLNYWFKDTNRKVYLVSPFLDADRLVDVCHLIIQNRLTANLDIFYVNQQCNREQRIFEVKQKALKSFDAKDQMFVEYKIYSSIVYPMQKFHCKFIAAIKDEQAEILVTSASFHGDHFTCSNMDTLHFSTMSESEFIEKFLCPIQASANVRK